MTNETTTRTHTPGPWQAYIGPVNMNGGLNPFFRGTVAVLKHSGEDDDVVVITDTNRPAHDYEANARLIAAAPEMLEALQAEHEAILVLKAWLRATPEEREQSHPFGITSLVNRAYLQGRAAIAKALG